MYLKKCHRCSNQIKIKSIIGSAYCDTCKEYNFKKEKERQKNLYKKRAAILREMRTKN